MAMRRSDLIEYAVPAKCRRDTEQKWNGWGYADSQFYLDDTKQVAFTGHRFVPPPAGH